MAGKKRDSGKSLRRDELLALLKEEQQRSGCVDDAAVVALAQSLGLAVGEVYGVATFYSFLSRRPLGRHVIRVCKSVPCCLGDGEVVIAAIRDELGIAPGETTADGRFSLELVNCIGACDEAPAMLVDDEVHGGLTPEKVAGVLRSCD